MLIKSNVLFPTIGRRGAGLSQIDHIPLHIIGDIRQEDEEVTKLLEFYEIDLVVLAGFMVKVPKGFCEKWEGRMINIHPSLLPRYKGLNVHERVIENGDGASGCSVHFVTPEIDSGPIISQAMCYIFDDDTPDTLAAKVLEKEHELLPLTVINIARGKLKYSNGKLINNFYCNNDPVWIGDMAFESC